MGSADDRHAEQRDTPEGRLSYACYKVPKKPESDQCTKQDDFYWILESEAEIPDMKSLVRTIQPELIRRFGFVPSHLDNIPDSKINRIFDLTGGAVHEIRPRRSRRHTESERLNLRHDASTAVEPSGKQLHPEILAAVTAAASLGPPSVATILRLIQQHHRQQRQEFLQQCKHTVSPDELQAQSGKEDQHSRQFQRLPYQQQFRECHSNLLHKHLNAMQFWNRQHQLARTQNKTTQLSQSDFSRMAGTSFREDESTSSFLDAKKALNTRWASSKSVISHDTVSDVEIANVNHHARQAPPIAPSQLSSQLSQPIPNFEDQLAVQFGSIPQQQASETIETVPDPVDESSTKNVPHLLYPEGLNKRLSDAAETYLLQALYMEENDELESKMSLHELAAPNPLKDLSKLSIRMPKNFPFIDTRLQGQVFDCLLDVPPSLLLDTSSYRM